MIVISNYNKLNKKILVVLLSLSFVFSIFLVISITELNKNMDFYKNYEHVNGLIKNIREDENDKIIRVSYKIKDNLYSKDIDVESLEYTSVHIGDAIEIFYNKNNPSDARMATKSLSSIMIVIIMLSLITVASLAGAILYYIRIRTNIKLINNNQIVKAKFYRIEFKNSIIGNEKINYVYCKGIVNGEKRIFKSVGFRNKPKPLNDESIINVYVDNKRNYLVDVCEIFE